MEQRIKHYLINIKICMKKLMIKIQTLVLFMTGVLLINSCTTNNSSPVEERDEVEPIIIHDTIIDSKCVKELDSIKYVYELTKDSLKYTRDSIGEDLFVARYKLGRIKYYTSIANKGNNIKYYRGWILRTLND